MSDAPKPENPADHKADGKKKGKPIVKILIGGVLLGGIGLGAFMFLSGKSAATEDHAKPSTDKHAEPTIEAADKKTKTQVIKLSPIIVNLRNTKGTRYLKCTIGMETASPAVAEELTRLSPQLSDFLVEKFSTVDISDVDNSAGRTKLKREILTGTNELLESGFINAVYFTEFVIQ